MKRLHLLLLGLSLLLGLATAQAATQIVSQRSGACIRGAAATSPCHPSPAQQFDFTAGGSIVNEGKCLTVASGAKAGDRPTLAACGLGASQAWQREADLIKSQASGLCLRLGPGAAGVELNSCAYDADRRWSLTGVPAGWPTATSTDPTAVVPGSSVTSAEALRLVRWIQAETSICNTAFCWKKPGYDRGIGIAPSDCPAGKVNQNGLCYDPPRDGYGCTATSCSAGCPSGYSSSGVATCHYTGGGTTYTKKPHARPIGGCQKSRFQCGGLCYDREDDGQHCRSDYAMNACGICSYQGAWDVSRATYTRAAGTVPQNCLSNRVKQDGLCYEPARTGYTCTVTVCTQQCAAGSVPCGSGCAQNTGTCTAAIADMVVSPAIMLAGMVSGETGSAALVGLKDAVQDAKKAAEMGADYAALALILKNSIQAYMAAAEKDLAGIATPQVAQQLAAKYGSGSANYRHVAREYALVQIKAAVANMFADLAILAVSVIDPTGVAGTISAYAKPECTQHTAIP